MAKDNTYKGITPKGTFKYPHLTRDNVDYGTKEFPKPFGELNCRLILSSDAMQKLRTELKPIMELAIEEGKAADKLRKPAARKKNPFSINEIGNPGYTEDDEGELVETGEFELNVKTRFSGKVKKTGEEWSKVIPVFDSKRKPLRGIKIWGGTVGRLAFNAKPYWVAGQGMCGVSLYLTAAMIFELQTEGGGNADSFGFEEEEGGYEYSENDSTEGDTEGQPSGDDGDADDGDDADSNDSDAPDAVDTGDDEDF